MKFLFLTLIIAVHFPLMAQIEKIDDPYQKGVIIDGYLKGVWEYYEGKELAVKVDYDNGKLLYLKPDSSQYTVKVKEEWVTTLVDRHPRFLGSYSEVYENLAKYLSNNYSTIVNSEVDLVLELTIGKNGRIINKEVIGTSSKYFEEMVLKASELIPNFWINAIFEGEDVDSKIGFPISFVIGRKKKERKQNEVYEGKLMGRITVMKYTTSTAY